MTAICADSRPTRAFRRPKRSFDGPPRASGCGADREESRLPNVVANAKQLDIMSDRACPEQLTAADDVIGHRSCSLGTSAKMLL
jgi:hypothetical protein